MNHYIFSILYMAILSYFGHLAKITKTTNLVLIVLTGIVVNIPIKGLSINDITYSFLGEMSVFLFAFSLISIFEIFKNTQNTLMNLKAFVFVFVFGLILYLDTLNFIPLDLYYQNPSVIIIICCVITVLAYFIHRPLGIIYLICLLSYELEILDSKNLFDYFIDVGIWCFSILYILYNFAIILKKIK